MRHVLFLAVPLGAAVLFAGCSSGGSAANAEMATPSAPVAEAYVASPKQHWEALADANRREVAAERAAAKSRDTGAVVRPASRPAPAPRAFPEAAVEPAAVAVPAAYPEVAPMPVAAAPVPVVAAPGRAPACRPNPCCPPKACVDPCAGGKCCLPPPAFCDPCAGGKCGIPEPAWGPCEPK
jgi:hypothetical protein